MLGDPGLYADGERVRAVITQSARSAEEQVAWLMREWEELAPRALARRMSEF